MTQPEFRADLHVHSTVSDGTGSPTRLLREAASIGLDAMAITDHDSTAGWSEATAAAREHGVILIPGMEFSTQHDGTSVHLLAYLFDPSDAKIVAETARIRDDRLHRAERIVQRIGADYDLTWEDVLAQAAEGATFGRPHIADALVARGHAPTRSDAFASILHPRAGYYEPHYAPDTLKAVTMVRAAGGVPVLAHPGTFGAARMVPRTRLAQLAAGGLAGVEVDHPENAEDAKPILRAWAEEFGLVVTGSSDYHGSGKPNRLGECSTGRRAYDRLVGMATGSSPITPE